LSLAALSRSPSAIYSRTCRKTSLSNSPKSTLAIAYILSKHFKFIRPSYIFVATVILWFLVTKGMSYFIDTLFGTVLAIALWGELREELSELFKRKS